MKNTKHDSIPYTLANLSHLLKEKRASLFKGGDNSNGGMMTKVQEDLTAKLKDEYDALLKDYRSGEINYPRFAEKAQKIKEFLLNHPEIGSPSFPRATVIMQISQLLNFDINRH